MAMAVDDRIDILFEPVTINGLTLANRLVMAPMTRCFSPGGVPGPDVAAYYRRRAEGGIGLIMTEGTWIPHPSASNDDNAPRFYGDDALAGWKHVVDEVHAAGGRIMPQLWHVGQTDTVELEGLYAEERSFEATQVGPSGMIGKLGSMPTLRGKPADPGVIDEVIDAYATAAQSAHRLGFDGIELHGAHGYLLDQFNWSVTNLRDDRYGGGISDRTRFACEVVAEIRRRTAPDFPIVMRMSQWKLQNYRARLADTPQELADVLEPMVEAGVDAFHCSQRRFWEGEFGTDLNLAGWARKLTGLPSIAVGSVSLETDFLKTLIGASSEAGGIDRLLDMMARREFDMIAIGRALLVDPNWAIKIRQGAFDTIEPYTPQALGSLS
jgi:2,4-dienoyl-CoA reductase-like NADH-dependent reductase (Old Yellow Enzyme family)